MYNDIINSLMLSNYTHKQYVYVEELFQMVGPDHRTLINSYEFYLQLKTAKPFHPLVGQHPSGAN